MSSLQIGDIPRLLVGQVSDARHRGTPYRGMLHCWRTMAAEEGFRALYSGLAPALLRQVTNFLFCLMSTAHFLGTIGGTQNFLTRNRLL